MAIIPKYQQRRTLPGTTGQQMAPLSIVGKSPLQTIGEAGMPISGVLSEAAQRVQAREDKVKRSQDFKGFFDELSQEYERVGLEENIADSASLTKFQAYTRNKIAEYAKNHTGSADSGADLRLRMEEQVGTFHANARSRMRDAQIKILDEDWGDRVSNWSRDVYNGTKPRAAVMAEITSAMEADFAGQYSKTQMLDRIEAAQAEVLGNELLYHADAGDYDTVERLINTDPEIIETIPREKAIGLLREANQYKRRKREIQMQEDIQRNRRVRALGKPSSALTAEELFFVETGGWRPQGNKPTAMMQDMAFLEAATRKHGPNSQFVKDIRQKMDLDPAINAALDPSGLAAQDRKFADMGLAVDSKERKHLVSQLMDQDPKYLIKLNLRQRQPELQDIYQRAMSEMSTQIGHIENAIYLATMGERLEDVPPAQRKQRLNAAIKAAQSGETAAFVTGRTGQIASLASPEGIAGQLEGALVPIVSATTLKFMNEAREKSKTGSTGFGSISAPELKIMQGSEGSLDPAHGAEMLRTLLRLRGAYRNTIVDQHSRYYKDLSMITGNADVPPPPIEGYVPKAPAAQSANGEVVVPLQGWETGTRPAEPVPPMQGQEEIMSMSQPPASEQQPAEIEGIAEAQIIEAINILEELGEENVGAGADVTLPDGTVVPGSAIQQFVINSNL
jgi:hypothetical protein